MRRPLFCFDPSKAGEEYKKDLEFVQESIRRQQVVLFGIPWHTDTRLVKWLLDEHEISYLPIHTDDLDNQVEVEEVLYRCTGGHSVLPYVFVDQRYVGSRHEIWNHYARQTLRQLVGLPHLQRKWPPWYPEDHPERIELEKRMPKY